MLEDKNLILNNKNLLTETINNGKDYTLIEIANKTYGIETQNVLEIVKIMELDYPNKLPDCILGIIKYEQTPVGVIDLRRIFKEERIVYNLSAKVIIAKTKESITAIICDNVSDIKKLDSTNIHSLPYKKEEDFFDGIYMLEEDNIYLLNLDNIVNYIAQNRFEFESNEIINYLIEDETSKEILKQRKNLLIKTLTEVQQTNTALYDRGVSFSINNVKYYINMASVKEFHKINNAKFIKLPNTKDFIIGLINIKGDYITVLDIRRFFGNPKTEIKEKSTMIILNSDEFKLGILADEICESMNVDFDEIIQNRLQKQEDGKMMEFVKDNEIYQVLDIEKLLQDERLAVV